MPLSADNLKENGGDPEFDPWPFSSRSSVSPDPGIPALAAGISHHCRTVLEI